MLHARNEHAMNVQLSKRYTQVQGQFPKASQNVTIESLALPIVSSTDSPAGGLTTGAVVGAESMLIGYSYQKTPTGLNSVNLLLHSLVLVITKFRTSVGVRGLRVPHISPKPNPNPNWCWGEGIVCLTLALTLTRIGVGVRGLCVPWTCNLVHPDISHHT